jgi:hypothetical protein
LNQGFSPERWAFEITHVLNAVLGKEHFPIDVTAIAREYTAQKFPSDPIVRVQGENLPGFEGALFKAPSGKKGWGIFYNNRMSSKGRINFTLAHELGHYLLHRLAYPDDRQCIHVCAQRYDRPGFAALKHRNNAGAGDAGSHLETEFLQMFRDKARRTVFLLAQLGILVNVTAPRDQLTLDLNGTLLDLLLKIQHPRLCIQHLSKTALREAQAIRRNQFDGACLAPLRADTSKFQEYHPSDGASRMEMGRRSARG